MPMGYTGTGQQVQTMRAAWAAPCRGGAAENGSAGPVVGFRHSRNRLSGLRTARGRSWNYKLPEARGKSCIAGRDDGAAAIAATGRSVRHRRRVPRGRRPLRWATAGSCAAPSSLARRTQCIGRPH
ncbi:hypothetical protein Taro_032922 [Colocasia esculenta]|uniref:Uncharacterized protein n=1 Tax=Colocasia esculenta TaxID=4460 RepID=A0A843VTX5_COLES|nr:hypothetical protein [Colocasia esculenta]